MLLKKVFIINYCRINSFKTLETPTHVDAFKKMTYEKFRQFEANFKEKIDE